MKTMAQPIAQIAPFGVRMPDDLKEWLAQRAEENGRSMNAELVKLLKDERAKEGKAYA